MNTPLNSAKTTIFSTIIPQNLTTFLKRFLSFYYSFLSLNQDFI